VPKDIYFITTLRRNQDSSVSVVIRLRAGLPGFYFRLGRTVYFSLRHRVQTGL